jgi:hypothetical protein
MAATRRKAVHRAEEAEERLAKANELLAEARRGKVRWFVLRLASRRLCSRRCNDSACRDDEQGASDAALAAERERSNQLQLQLVRDTTSCDTHSHTLVFLHPMWVTLLSVSFSPSCAHAQRTNAVNCSCRVWPSGCCRCRSWASACGGDVSRRFGASTAATLVLLRNGVQTRARVVCIHISRLL